MTLESLKYNIIKRGVVSCALFYFSRLHSRICARAVRAVMLFRTKAQNIIVFKNDRNTDFSDNTKALFEYLISNGYQEKYKIVWCVSDKRICSNIISDRVKCVISDSRNGWTSFGAFYYGAVSKFFFYSHDTSFLNNVHCKDQISINLGHGNSYKAPKRDLYEKLDTNYRFDFLLVSGPAFVDAKARYWHCDRSKILDLGLPRYDWLTAKNDQRELLDRLLGHYPADIKKIVIWLPTFYNNEEMGFPENTIRPPLGFSGLSDMLELHKLDALCSDADVMLLIKKHPAQIDWTVSGKLNNIVVLNDRKMRENDISLCSLMSVCDALITDFSSAAVDFMLLDRPIGYVLTEYEQYKRTRGFIFDDTLRFMPGEKLYGLEDLKRFISDISENIDPFKEERHEIRALMHNESEGYCKRLVARIGL